MYTASSPISFAYSKCSCSVPAPVPRHRNGNNTSQQYTLHVTSHTACVHAVPIFSIGPDVYST